MSYEGTIQITPSLTVSFYFNLIYSSSSLYWLKAYHKNCVFSPKKIQSVYLQNTEHHRTHRKCLIIKWINLSTTIHHVFLLQSWFLPRKLLNSLSLTKPKIPKCLSRLLSVSYEAAPLKSPKKHLRSVPILGTCKAQPFHYNTIDEYLILTLKMPWKHQCDFALKLLFC